MKKLDGFKKIKHGGSSLINVGLWNPGTKEYVNISVRDWDYENIYGGLASKDCEEYGEDVLEKLYHMSIDKEALNDYNIEKGIPFIGCEVEVVKGRKYNKGDKGIVKRMYDVKDCYGRCVAEYILCENGMKINKNNVRVIGRGY